MSEAWQTFFWSPVDLTSLGVFRILAGLLVVLNAITLARSQRLLLDPDGYVSDACWRSSPYTAGTVVLGVLPWKRTWIQLVLFLYGVSGLVILVGSGDVPVLCAALFAFATFRGLCMRNPIFRHSGDVLLGILLLLLACSPSTEALSLEALRRGTPAEPQPAPALRLMQVQLSVLYTTSVLYKLRGETWRRGTATHHVVQLLGHRKRRLPAALDTPALHRVATYGTLLVEFAGGLLVWFPATRYPALLAIAGLHVVLQLLMRMHLFQFVMLSALVLFVPGEDMARLLAWLGVL